MTLEKSTAADSDMIRTLDDEIEKLEAENKEKEAELLAQQSRKVSHLSSIISDSGKKEAPDMMKFRSSLDMGARGSSNMGKSRTSYAELQREIRESSSLAAS